MNKGIYRPTARVAAVRTPVALRAGILLLLASALCLSLLSTAHAQAMGGPGLPAMPSDQADRLIAEPPNATPPQTALQRMAPDEAARMLASRRAREEDVLIRAFVGFLPF